MLHPRRGLVPILLLAGACDSSSTPGLAPPLPAVEDTPTTTTTTTPTPDAPPGPSPLRAVALAAGGQTSYALMSDGTVRGWGSSRSSALGQTDIDLVATPITIAGVERAVAIAAGGEPTSATACAIRDDASVLCWGGSKGFPFELEAGVAGALPTEIPVLAGAREIALGEAFGCARMGDGSVQCWGLLPGRSRHADPSAMDELHDIVELRAAKLHACALGRAGDAWCWGSNRSGAVDWQDYPGGSRSLPIRVAELPAALELGLADDVSCSRHADGSVRCWNRGELQPLVLDRKPLAFARGGASAHLCVVVEGGGARCMGPRGTPSLGTDDKSGADGALPTAVPGLPVVTAAATAPQHGCALAEDGHVWCWGDNAFGQLGDGTTIDRASPVRAEHLLDRELEPPVPVAVEDLGPVERFEGLPEGCRAGSLALSISGLPRPRLDVRSAVARVGRETISVYLRDHGFDAGQDPLYERPHGHGLGLELELGRQRITERRIRNPQPWEEGETVSSSRPLPVTVGTYVSAAAWFAMGTPADRRELEIKLMASDGSRFLTTPTARAGDVQQVELTRIGPDWVCGTLTFVGVRGELRGDFAARVHE